MRCRFALPLVLLAACGDPPVSVTEAPNRTPPSPTPVVEEVPLEPRTIEREDGINVDIREVGHGPALRVGDRVTAHVVARVFESEEPFLSTRINGYAMTYSLDVGATDTPIEGLRRALAELRVGSLANIHIPAELAYGESGLESVGIPPDSPLEFEVRIKRKL